jgi:hypothetical protein
LTGHAFIAYEDFYTGNRAKETCGVIAAHLGFDWSLECRLSSFKELGRARLRRRAAADAGRSDLVIVSGRGTGLPDGVRQWIELWLARGRKPMSLVAMFACPEDCAWPAGLAGACLASVAERPSAINAPCVASSAKWASRTIRSAAE